jgi:LacI family transcriptional regulator
MTLLVEHLAGHGHTRIAYIGGPPTFTSGLERLAGFRGAIDRLGLDPRHAYVELGDAVWSPESGAAATERLLALAEPPTAIVTSGDTLALGAMSACRTAGLSLPADMALASFDDPAFGELLDPPVTALKRCDAEMGSLAARLLLAALDHGVDGPPVETRLPMELVARRSCGCP